MTSKTAKRKVKALQKALSVGKLSKGCALQVESLEAVLKLVTFSDCIIILDKNLGFKRKTTFGWT